METRLYDAEDLFLRGEHPDTKTTNDFFKILSEKKKVVPKRKYTDTRSTRQIQCIETGQIFESAAIACRELDINRGNLSMHLRRQRYPNVKGLHYRYVGEKEVHVKKMKAVKCLVDGKLHKNAMQAATFYEISYKRLMKHLKGLKKTPHINGLKFEYVQEV